MRISTGKRVVEIDVNDLFQIDDTDITKEYAEQAAHYAYYAVAAAEAEAESSRAVVRRERLYAELDGHFREELRSTVDKVTEPMVKQEIMADAEYVEMRHLEIVTKYNHTAMKALCKALEMRADMLVSMGAHMRHEISMTGMHIKEGKLEGSIEELKRAVRDAQKAKSRQS